MTESHYTIAHYDTNTGRFGGLGLQLSAACTRVTSSEPKIGSKRLRAALGVQRVTLTFFSEPRKAFNAEMVVLGALGGGGICGFSLGMAAVEPISTCWRAGKRLCVLIETKKGF